MVSRIDRALDDYCKIAHKRPPVSLLYRAICTLVALLIAFIYRYCRSKIYTDLLGLMFGHLHARSSPLMKSVVAPRRRCTLRFVCTLVGRTEWYEPIGTLSLPALYDLPLCPLLLKIKIKQFNNWYFVKAPEKSS